MIIVAGLLSGALTGALVAKRRGGARLDQLQYAAGYGIAFMLVGLFLTILIERSL